MPDAMEIHMIQAKNRERKQNNNNYYRRFSGILEFPAISNKFGMETPFHKNN